MVCVVIGVKLVVGLVCVCVCVCVCVFFSPQITDHFAWQYFVCWPLSDIINRIDVTNRGGFCGDLPYFFTLAIFLALYHGFLLIRELC